MGPDVVVPITACSDREDWKVAYLLCDRVGGLRRGEFEGVTFNDDGPDSFVFVGGRLLFAITPDCPEKKRIVDSGVR